MSAIDEINGLLEHVGGVIGVCGFKPAHPLRAFTEGADAKNEPAGEKMEK